MKKYNFVKYFALLIVLLLAVGAQAYSQYAVSPTSVSFGSGGGNQTISVSVSNYTSWSVSSYPFWTVVSPTGGFNSGSFNISCSVNTSTSSRSGSITVTFAGATRTISVTQAGAPPPPYITASPSSISVGYSAGSSSIGVGSNVSWSVSYDGWLYPYPQSGTGNGGFGFTYSVNTSTSPRTGYVTISGGGVSSTVTITQAGAPPPQYNISTTANPTYGGSASGGGTYTSGATATVTATAFAGSGYVFASWTENGSVVSTNPSYSFTVTGGRSLTANFIYVSYNISTSSSPSNGGTTSGRGSYGSGSTAYVTATQYAGYNFANWTENGSVVSTSSSYSFTVTGNRSLTANFAPIPCTITTSSSPTGGGTTSGGGTYNYGTAVTVNAQTNPGYTFTNWTEGSTVVSTNANYAFTVSGNRSIVANFTPIPCTITTSSSPTGGGTTSGGGTYNYGTAVTVNAQSNTGYTFTNWTEGSTVVSTNANYAFTASGNRSLTANFALIQSTYINISQTFVLFNSSGGITSDTVSADTSWSASTNNSNWLSASGSGNGNGIITITCPQNPNSDIRMDSIKINGVTSIIVVQAGVNNSFDNRMMTMKMNGHGQGYPVHDFIYNAFNDAYTKQLPQLYHDIDSSLSAYHVWQSDRKTGLPPAINSINYSLSASTANLNSQIGTIQVKLFPFMHCYSIGSDPFGATCMLLYGLTINGTLSVDTNSSAYILRVNFTNVSIDKKFGKAFPRGFAGILTSIPIVNIFVEDYVMHYVWDNLENGIKQKLSDTTITLFKYADLPNNVSPPVFQDAVNSFPMRITLSTDQTSGSLTLGMNFMQGTSPSDTSFTSYNPTTPANPTFDYLGFGCPYYSFQNAFGNWTANTKPSGDALVLETVLLNSMNGFSTPSIRIPIPWKDIVGDLPPGSNLDTSVLHGAVLDDSIRAIPNSKWANTDSIIARAQRQGFDVIPQLTQMESDVATMNGGIMAPDNSGGAGEPAGYTYIDGKTYLYYLKIFSHAAVRRYANKISIWAIESELNAAKYAQLFMNTRHGNLWQDEGSGGFQDKLWRVLVDAVRQEDPTAKLTSPLHMLNMMKGLQRFAPDLDIVGINVYPNDFFAAPVMGFSVGEMVWATRRALMGLGTINGVNMANKDVHVTETNYPGIIPDPSPDAPNGSSLSTNLSYFSWGRQSTYMNDALQTSLANGAKGFFWWGFLDHDSMTTSERQIGSYADYGSLIVHNTNPIKFKLAASAFQGKAILTSVYPGKASFILANRSVSNTNLNGFVALAAERDSLVSGNNLVFATLSRNHISQTYQQNMNGLKHQSWGQDQSQFHLKQTFMPVVAQSSLPRDAFFAATAPVTLQASCIEGGTGTDTLGYLDPWFLDGSGNQPNTFRNISLAPSFSDNVFLGQTIISGTYYSLSAPQTINFGGSVGVRNMSLWKWTASPANSATFQDPLARQTGVVFDSSNAVVIANLKGIHLSNDTSAFSNNSQRKFVQTIVNGAKWLHQVYSSADHVWIEHSSDGGTTWLLGNGGQPLDGTNGGKNPSISFSSRTDWGNNYIGVVWQQPNGSTYTIQGMLFNQISGGNGLPYSATGTSTTLFSEQLDSYSIDANPNIIVNFFTYVVTFERKNSSGSPGINWLVGSFYDNGSRVYGLNYPLNGVVAGTDQNSTNASLSLNPYYSNSSCADMDCIYQTGSGLRYLWLDFYNNGGSWQFTQQSIPSSIGYSGPVNINPSTISFPNGNFAAGWIEYDQLAYYCYSASPSVIYYYGSGVQSCAINGGGDNSGFAAWSQNNYGTWSNKSIRFQNYTPSSSTIQTLSTAGKYVQLANSVTSSLNNMYVSSFYPVTIPYYFNTSQTLDPLSKNSSILPVAGRGCIINNGDASYSYSFSGLNVDGKNIEFVDAPDNSDYSNISNLNNALITEPFQLTANSKVIFTEKSGFADSAATVKMLERKWKGENGYIRYKIEFIDNKTEKVVGAIKNVSLTSSNVYSNNMQSYLLNTKGFTNKVIKARIVFETNLINPASSDSSQNLSSNNVIINGKILRRNFKQPAIILTKSFADADTAMSLGKESIDELTINGLDLPTSYMLEQNYPNPFNPTTVIKYQLPDLETKNSVSLRVYDILGREVAVLADGMKDAGYYTATFDGSKYSSGVYFVRFIAQPQNGNHPYVKVTKMLLMK